MTKVEQQIKCVRLLITEQNLSLTHFLPLENQLPLEYRTACSLNSNMSWTKILKLNTFTDTVLYTAYESYMALGHLSHAFSTDNN